MFYCKHKLPPLSSATRLLPCAAWLLFSGFILLLTGLCTPVGAQPPGSGGYGSGGSGGSGSGSGGGSGGPPSSPPAVAHWEDRSTREGMATFFPNSGPAQSASWSTGSQDNWGAVENNQAVYGNELVTLQTNGVYHIKYVWVPTAANEPPPASIILRVISHADWHGPSYRSTGTADNGLGTQQTVGVDSSFGDATTAKYFAMDSSSGVVQKEVAVNSIVHAAGQSVPPQASHSAYNSVRVSKEVSAYLYDVNLNVHGVTLDTSGGNNILIGQLCTADVTTNAPISISNYDWHVSGPTFAAFMGYENQSHGYVVPVPWTTWASPYPAWHWSDEHGGDKTVTYFANAYYNGEDIGTLTDSKKVKVEAPTYSLTATTTSVRYTVGQADVMAASPNGDFGITYHAWAQTPELFGRNSGNWGYLQLCSLNRVMRSVILPFFKRTNTDGWLDTDWCYGASGRIDPPYNADGTNANQYDEPSSSLGTSIWDYYVGDSFTMYNMYLPPGTGAQWVPLKMGRWGWTASGSRNVFDPWSPNPPNGSVTWYGSFDTREHPHWDNVFSGTGGTTN